MTLSQSPAARFQSNDRFVFGIYPGGEAGSDDGIAAGPPGDPARIEDALTDLAGTADPFIVRVYERFSDADAPSRWPRQTPKDYTRYLRPGRLLDLVVMFQSKSGDVAGFLNFLRSLIAQHGPSLYSIQVTEEANFADGPDYIDGPWPRVREALVEGVKAANKEALRQGLTGLRVGFNSTPTFGSATEFWRGIGSLGGQAFVDAAGIPESIPIHVAENGWPTGPARSFERQSLVFETTIRTLLEVRDRLNIRRYTIFSLRDAESFAPDFADNIFYSFGLMRSDYTPKPAFETCRRLIVEFGGHV